jgi:tRNA-2-methylthio-N6-dimethylallyladenosine synthase
MDIEVQKYISSKERLEKASNIPGAPKFYIETYGCQMNVADSEVVMSVMIDEGYAVTDQEDQADVIFINTCAVRDNAEKRIRNRLVALNALKKRKPGLLIGLLGCMAERLKEKLVEEEQVLDIIAGPDAYRSLPDLVKEAEDGSKAINVLPVSGRNLC